MLLFDMFSTPSLPVVNSPRYLQPGPNSIANGKQLEYISSQRNLAPNGSVQFAKTERHSHNFRTDMSERVSLSPSTRLTLALVSLTNPCPVSTTTPPVSTLPHFDHPQGRGGRGTSSGPSRGTTSDRGGRGSNRGSNRGGRGGSSASTASERPKKEAILDLSKYIDQQIRVKFAGGREVVGTLKGFDQLMNLVMDEVKENLRDEEGNTTDKTRELGLVVLRGTALTVINPAEGFESIEKYV